MPKSLTRNDPHDPIDQKGRRAVVAATRHPYAFDPSAERAREVDRAIRQHLIASVGRIVQAARIGGLAAPGDFASWSARVTRVRLAPPRLWACYQALVQALAADDAAGFERHVDELFGDEVREAPRDEVVTLRDEDLNPLDVERYGRILDDNPDVPLRLQAVSRQETMRIRSLLSEAKAIIVAACPALLTEIETFGHQIVLVTSGAGAAEFGGAASVFLWGAVALNPNRVPDRLALLEGLVHEAAHALLFGLTLGENLTRNDPSQRYPSPLRRDPRPIEGIVHATYVLARMAYALDVASRSPEASGVERAKASQRRAEHLRSFHAGLAVVESHAVFTQAGSAIFDECRAAMAALERRLSMADGRRVRVTANPSTWFALFRRR
jgi:hypothetical protein